MSSSLSQIRDARLAKAARLRTLGIAPYPSQARRTHGCGEVVTRFEELEGKTVTVAGRLISFREHGKLCFGHVQDQSGRVQLFVQKDVLQNMDPASGTLGFAELAVFDVGDIVEATGSVGRTKKGEISVLPTHLRLLTKSLRPLPEKWAGLKDREAVLRRRYLDTTLEPERRAPFEAVARMLKAIRGYLAERGFLEFHTPIIQPEYGGGTAKPFTTHVLALHSDMYLAISHELYLKRLIVAGFEKVFTIGRYFRNEGIDATHHPEFSKVETMTAYENYEYNMDLVEGLFVHVAREAFGKTEFTVAGNRVDVAKRWRRVAMADAVRDATGTDFRTLASVEDANRVLDRLGVAEREATIGHALVRAFEASVQPKLIEPTLVYGHPVEISPLAKPMTSDPRFVERFEIFVGGVELGDNWSEQNDPVELLKVWKERYDVSALDRGEIHPIDYDFLEALEHGMPPTTGIGPGIERMAMLFLEEPNIDNVLFFPMMRRAVSDYNREIYGIENARTPVLSGELALSVQGFAERVSAGELTAGPSGIRVRPELLAFRRDDGTLSLYARAEIEGGRIEGQRVRVVDVMASRSSTREELGAAKKALADACEALARPIRQHFPALPCEIEVSALREAQEE